MLAGGARAGSTAERVAAAAAARVPRVPPLPEQQQLVEEGLTLLVVGVGARVRWCAPF